MANIRSLIVKIGAQTEEIDRALTKLGASVRSTAAEIKEMDKTPIGQAAIRSFNEMRAAADGIAQAQQRVADRARLAAVGIEQIGGASRLTKSELDAVNRTLQNGLDAFRALGKTAPADMQRVADAVSKQRLALEGTTKQTGLMSQAQGLLTGRLLAFVGPAALGAAIKQSLDFADNLTKMSDRTGIGAVALQRLDAVAKASGNTLEQVAGAVNRFQRDLASGKADDKIRALGLSVQELKALSPDEQFFAIARAIKQIEDPAQQARVAMELFGRAGAEMLPTLKADVDGLKDSTVKMSAESVKALDDFGDMLGRWKVGAVAALGEVAAATITVVTNIAKLPAAIKNAQDLSNKQISVPSQIGGRGILSDAELATLSGAERQRLIQSRLQGNSVPIPKAPSQNLPGLPNIEAPSGEELDRITKAYDRQQDALKDTAAAQKTLADAAKKSAQEYRAFKNELGIREMENYTAAQKASAQQVEENIRLEFAMNKLYIANAQAIGAYDSGITLASRNIKPFGLLVEGTVKQISDQGKALKSSFGDFLKGNLSDLFGGANSLKSGLQNVVGNIGKGIFEGIGNIISGGISGLIGSGISLIGKGFSKLFGSGEKGKVDEIRQALIDQRGGWEGINRAAHDAGLTLERVLNARTVKDYEAAVRDLDDAIKFQDDAMASLEETTKKYGFTIDELGPAFARQQLDKQAQSLFQDFSVLSAAGIDLNTVITRMGGSIQDFITQALRTGTEVPEAMRPMLQRMIDMGLLTDANGRKFDSLEDSGITFTESMSQGFSRVVQSVEKLTQAIARGLGIALDTVETKVKNIPDVNVGVHFNIDDVPNNFDFGPDVRFGSQGGQVTASGIQRFAGGGVVLPFRRRGQDTVPAMLTPGELVLNQGQQDAVRNAIAGGSVSGTMARVFQGEFTNLRNELARDRAEQPKVIARMVRDAVQTARPRR